MKTVSLLKAPQAKAGYSVAHIPHAWYIACRSRDLRRKPLAITIAGTPIVLFRGGSGQAGALMDRCPHRNVPLSSGFVSGDNLVCCYHGWEFNAEGTCCKVPGLIEDSQPRSAQSRRAISFPVREQDGWVWVWPTADRPPEGQPFAMPSLPGHTVALRVVEAPGTLHATLENALDVPHTSFLHGGLFRTPEKTNRIEARVYRYGDRVECHYIGEPRPKGLVGRLLAPSGAIVEHYDRFFLPSIAQVEYRIGEDIHLLVNAAATPIADFKTRLFAQIQFKTRLPGPLLKLILEPFGRFIFNQDKRILGQQTETTQIFGGEAFQSTEIDLLGPHIWRLLREAERRKPGDPLPDPERLDYEKTIHFMT